MVVTIMGIDSQHNLDNIFHGNNYNLATYPYLVMGVKVVEKLFLENQFILDVVATVCKFNETKVVVGVMKGSNDTGDSLQGDVDVLTSFDAINNIHPGNGRVNLDIRTWSNF